MSERHWRRLHRSTFQKTRLGVQGSSNLCATRGPLPSNHEPSVTADRASHQLPRQTPFHRQSLEKFIASTNTSLLTIGPCYRNTSLSPLDMTSAIPRRTPARVGSHDSSIFSTFFSLCLHCLHVDQAYGSRVHDTNLHFASGDQPVHPLARRRGHLCFEFPCRGCSVFCVSHVGGSFLPVEYLVGRIV